MKTIKLTLLSLMIFSCARSNDTENNTNNLTQNDFIGYWKIKEYKFYNKSDLKYLGSKPPTCSSINVYSLLDKNYLHISGRDTQCSNYITGQEGTWKFNPTDKSFNFYGDATYQTNKVTKDEIELISFIEGIVDYNYYEPSSDYNGDGKFDRVTTVLVRK